jgi:hypothetical protein
MAKVVSTDGSDDDVTGVTSDINPTHIRIRSVCRPNFDFDETISCEDENYSSVESEEENSYRPTYYDLDNIPLSSNEPTFQPTIESLGSSPPFRSISVDRGIQFASLKEGTSQQDPKRKTKKKNGGKGLYFENVMCIVS